MGRWDWLCQSQLQQAQKPSSDVVMEGWMSSSCELGLFRHCPLLASISLSWRAWHTVWQHYCPWISRLNFLGALASNPASLPGAILTRVTNQSLKGRTWLCPFPAQWSWLSPYASKHEANRHFQSPYLLLSKAVFIPLRRGGQWPGMYFTLLILCLDRQGCQNPDQLARPYQTFLLRPSPDHH
jgi:hypothetical protein